MKQGKRNSSARTSRATLLGVGIAAVLAFVGPQAAVAAPTWWTFYNGETTQNTTKTSQHWSALLGGKAGPPDWHNPARLDRYYIVSKTASGSLIASASTTANTASISHRSTANARSECYWNRSIPGGYAKIQCRSHRN